MKTILDVNPLSPTFSTDHLYLSAYLVCRGYELEKTKDGDDGRVQFLFADSVSLRSAAAEFLSGGTVNARQFSFEVLKLKKYFSRRH